MNTSPTATNQHSTGACCNLKRNNWLKLLSNIAIPLTIGAFTVVIAVHQQNVAQSNREKDAAQAADVRQKDLETALAQRKENNQIAQSQRTEDKEIARLQRELDLNTTKEKLLQENELAEKQRNLSISQRQHELQIAYQNHLNEVLLEDERQKENILINAQRQLATLLLDYGSPFEDLYDRFRFVIQMKTREALRLLNPVRRTILVRNLYQANPFTEKWKEEKSLLFRANVSGVHFGHPIDDYEYDSEILYDHLGINEADIRYSSFCQVSFMSVPSFDHSNLDNTDWSYAFLSHFSFRNHMSMNEAIFSQSILREVKFEDININRISFQNNKECQKCTFTKTSMLGARFDNSYFPDSSFSSLSMTDSSMYNASFVGSTFINVILDRVNLSSANLKRCLFRDVSVVNCSSSKIVLNDAAFLNVNFSGRKGFTQEQLSYLSKQSNVVLPE